jgi:hypothetical protein
MMIDPQIILFGLVLACVLRAVTTDSKHSAVTPPIRTRFARAVAFVPGAAMFFVAYFGPVTGALDVASPATAFANLRMQGGSNHLLAAHHGGAVQS